nr:O-antigen ligase family protein [Eubacterium sp.]
MKAKWNLVTCLYIVFYALYSLSTRIIPTAVLCQGMAADLLYKAVILGGCVLAAGTLFLIRKTIKGNALLYLLGGFLVILVISTITNYKYGFVDNALGVVTFTTQLTVFYFLPLTMPKEMIHKCIRITGLCCSLLWTPACIVSLYQYVRNITYRTLNPAGNEVRQGITDGRLFGVFSDPNFAAFSSLILSILLVYVWRHTSKKWVKTYCIINILCNVLYLIMSNSRTIYIAAVGTILFFVFFTTYEREKGDTFRMGHFIFSLCKRGLLAVIGILAIYTLVFFPLQAVGQLTAPEREVGDMVREDVTTSNITNNRSTIWKHYLTLYKDKPIFGFSVRSALPYASNKYPGSYLDITQYVTHNGYLSLLVETGFTGFAVMGAFLILVLVQSIQRVRQKEKISASYMMFANLIIATLIFLVCFHDVFFTVNIETMLLFIAIGYISSINARH